MISFMTEVHLDEIVKIHMESFQGFFLTFLGERFLSLYYKRVIHSDKTIKLVYLENNEVKGFIIGIMNPSGFYSTLLRQDWFRFGFASVPAIFKKPKSFFRLMRALTKPYTTPKNSNVAELSSIAVMPNAQDKGIGTQLIKTFIDNVKSHSVTAIYLTTDNSNNEAVNAFYQKIGFKLKRVFETPEKRVMNEYWFEVF